MDNVTDTPLVRHVPGRRGLSQQVRAALDLDRTVVLLSHRDTELRRALESIDRPVRHTASVRLGDGRTATTMCDSGTPAPFAWLAKDKPAQVWRWACRRCGAVDERWSWPQDEADEAAPMVRYAVDPSGVDGPLARVPWRCPRGTCHGGARWLLVLPDSEAASGTSSGTTCGTSTPRNDETP